MRAPRTHTGGKIEQKDRRGENEVERKSVFVKRRTRGEKQEGGKGSNQPPGPNHVPLSFLFTQASLPAPHLDVLSCQNYFIRISAFTTSEGGMHGNDVQGSD